VPRWHAISKEYEQQGLLCVAGIAEEQHPERTRLFLQWQELPWPVMVDRLDLLGVKAVPLTFFLDEQGVVRAINPEPSDLDRLMAMPVVPSPVSETESPKSDPVMAPSEGDPPLAWRQYADQRVVWGKGAHLGEAVSAYQKALASRPNDGETHFRLGVAYGLRGDSSERHPGDFAKAVVHWQRALERDPNQYIWRRRLQQYGARTDKPYGFYTWVDQARQEIAQRGETPVKLEAPLTRSELALPARWSSSKAEENPDPNVLVRLDADGLAQAKVTVVPPRVRAGGVARIYLRLDPNRKAKAHWNNENEDLRCWVDLPSGWQGEAGDLRWPNPPETESTETRLLEFDLKVPEQAASGLRTVNAYTLYYICEDVSGVCYFLRQNIPIEIEILTERE